MGGGNPRGFATTSILNVDVARVGECFVVFDLDGGIRQGLCEVVLGFVSETEVILEVGVEVHGYYLYSFTFTLRQYTTFFQFHTQICSR